MPFPASIAEPPVDNAASPREIMAQLERMLTSPHFRHSKRYPVLLRFVVERTLEGQGAFLKERTVGVEAFQRDPAYDTNVDPIVRITAGEVRKRIAQYYHDEGHGDELRIDLPPGSYVPSFSRHSLPDQPVHEPAVGNGVPTGLHAVSEADEYAQPVVAEASIDRLAFRKRFSAGWIFAAGLCAAGVVAATVWLAHGRPQTAWEPWLASGAPVLVAVGEPGLVGLGAQTALPNPITVTDHLRHVHELAFSDAVALTRIATVLDHSGRAYRLLPAGGATFADMRQGPSILIGGIDNPWTTRVLESARYRFRHGSQGTSWIEDAHDLASRKWAVNFDQPYTELTEDFAIVARVVDPGTHQPVLIIAGVGEDGTKAASEFATDPDGLNSALGKDKDRNVEIVLGAQVINGVSGPPRILAREVW